MLSTLIALAAGVGIAAPKAIVPGALWLDDRDRHIQAHGGGILKVGDTYYWFGEDRAEDNPKEGRFVSCYSSKDLTRWRFRHRTAFTPDASGLGEVVERPKVYHDVKRKRFVMYLHLDDGRYRAAEVGVAVSDRIDGDFKLVKHFRPLGCQSRDIGQFVDDDGTAYLVFEDRPAQGFHIARLSEDFMDVVEDTCLVKAPLEGGAVVHYDGLYYAIGSALTGWDPNPNKYATAKSLKGPWTEFRDVAPPETRTYGSQSTLMLKVVGKKGTSVIFMADQWRPRTQWDSRYLWMPLEIGGGNLRLPEPRPWTIDVRSGLTTILP